MPLPSGILQDESDELVVSGAASARTDWLRYGLYLIWALAAVAGGIGVGLLLIGDRAAFTVQTPVPVATATLTVTSAAAASGQPQFTAAMPVPVQTLGQAASTDIRQAQAGSPFAVASGTNFQPAAGTQSALQPGFDPAGLPQGNLGTTPVR
jgi:hypothetical protein